MICLTINGPIMSLALDTNILIYAHHDQFAEHRAVREFLTELMGKPDSYFVSWQVCYEYIRLTTHSRVLTKPLTAREALADLVMYLNDPRCQVLVETVAHRQALQQIFKALPSARGNFTHDCHYAALLMEHGIERIATADADFKKFDFLDVINPLADA